MVIKIKSGIAFISQINIGLISKCVELQGGLGYGMLFNGFNGCFEILSWI